MVKIIFTIVLLSVSLSKAQIDLHRRNLMSSQFAVKNNLVKVAFFDADSTLRVSVSGSVSANSPTDVMILPFVAQRIAELNKKGYLVMIVSNQGGVGKGILPIEVADSALYYTTKLIKDQNSKAVIHYIDFADQEDHFRKPEVGMATHLENELNTKGLRVDWSRSFMVGDSAYKKGDTRPDGLPGNHFSNSDRLFAQNLKITFFEPNDFFGWRCHGIDVFDKADQVQEYIKTHKQRCPVLKVN